MRYLIFLFLILFYTNVLKSQFLSDTLKENKLEFFETRRTTAEYRLDSMDVITLDSIKSYFEYINKINIWFDNYSINKKHLSSEGERYFQDLTANVLLELYLDLMSNGYDNYLFKTKYSSNKKVVRLSSLPPYTNYPKIQNPLVLDLISFNTINSSLLDNCQLFENIIDEGSLKFYGDIFEKYEDYIKWKITIESNSCKIKNLNTILDSIEFFKKL